MHAFLRRSRRFLAGWRVTGTRGDARETLRAHTRRFTETQTLIRAFYAFLLYLAVSQLEEFSSFARHANLLPLWPVRWLKVLPAASFAPAVLALFIFYVAAGLLAAVLPGWRPARVAAAVGLLEYMALKNSYDKIGHSMHLLLIVSLLLIFLPRGWQRPAPRSDRRLRQGTLLVFWTCEAAVLLSYTMSGIGKLGGALLQLSRLEPNAFAPGALGMHIANRLLQTDSQSVVGAWIIEHPWLTWPAMPLAIYLELFSIVAAFRPALARPWALALVLFHVANYFAMTITFPPSCFLLALFFFRSPSDPGKTPWRTLLFDVPLAGDALHLLKATRQRSSDARTK